MSLKEKYRKSRFYKVGRTIYSFHIEGWIEQLKVLYIRLFDVHSKGLRELSNQFEGERCFIVANGPSLTFEDLALLKDEHCFSMNSVIKILDKTEWRPRFYGIQDMLVYEKIPELVEHCQSEYVFVSDKVLETNLPLPSAPIYFKLFLGGNYVDNPKPRFKFSSNASHYVYDGFSITYSLLQIACYLGFKEIYLIGCDCSYSADPKQHHFVNSGHIDPHAHLMGERMIEAYKAAKKYCDKHKIKVFNATRGGALEVFPRVKLDDVIEKDR